MMVVLVLAAATLGKLRGLNDIDRRWLGFIALSGLAGAASWLFYFVALKHGPVAGVAALDRISVALVFVLAILFLGDPFSWRGAAGAALVVAGSRPPDSSTTCSWPAVRLSFRTRKPGLDFASNRNASRPNGTHTSRRA